MAEGLLRDINLEQYESYSAGTKPSFVNPGSIEAMSQIGIDISNHRSKSVDEFPEGFFDIVVSVCDSARQSCPVFPAGTENIHWSIEDPADCQGDKEQVLAVFRKVRDELKARIQEQFGPE